MPTIPEILATCDARTPKTNETLLSEVIDNAPDKLNTLNEIAAAINDNETFFDTVVVKNDDITAGTGTKITYDKKGLVTGSASLTISDLPTTSVATTTTNGFMSSSDKSKLDGVASNANNYVHPTGNGNLHIPVTGATNNGKVLTAGSTDGSVSWQSIPAIAVATTTANGLMSSLDKKKLDNKMTGTTTLAIDAELTISLETTFGTDLTIGELQFLCNVKDTDSTSNTYNHYIDARNLITVTWVDNKTIKIFNEFSESIAINYIIKH
jgi:hypothetical protein